MRASRVGLSLFVVVLLLVFTSSAYTSRAADTKSDGLFHEVDDDPPPVFGIDTLASRLVGIDSEQLAQAIASPVGPKDAVTGDSLSPKTLELNLLSGVEFTGIVEHVEPTGSGHALWGGLAGVELGTMTLVVNGSVVVGTVRTPEAVYTIRTVGDGKYVIRQIDESSLPPLAEPLGDSASPRDPRAQSDDVPSDDGSVIDVMVVYTPLAKSHEGGRAAIEALIDLFVAETNQAYGNSGVIHRIRLVFRDEVQYTEYREEVGPGFDRDGGDLLSAIDLYRLRDELDGYMDHIHELRDLYAADLVHLITGNGDVGGVAYSDEVGNDSHGFAVTLGYTSGLVFAHELGHNMGLRHDRYQFIRNEGGGGRSLADWNFGYVNQRAFEPDAPDSAYWRTIMSYPNQCSVVERWCEWLPYFSNPQKTYNGDPMGVPADHPSTGADGPADAVRALNGNRHIVANYRQSETSPSPRAHLTLSPYWLSEKGGVSTVTATLHRPSNADTVLTVSASPADAVALSTNRTLTIPAGQTVSVDSVTITGVDNDDRTGDVSVTVSATATNPSNPGAIDPELVELAVADDETTPAVTLSLSSPEIVEGEDRISVTATLDNRSSVETTVVVSASPAEFVNVGDVGLLVIPAGQTSSSGWPVPVVAVDDDVLTGAEKKATVSGTATNSQGIIGPESVTLTILDDERPIFSEDSVAYTFTAGVAASRFLPEAAHGNGTLTYSISPAPDNGVTFIPGPPARIGASATSAAADETSYTLTATDGDGDTDTMTVTVTVRSPVCPGSAAAAGGMVADCEALLSARDTLAGGASLNWSEDVPIAEWDGVAAGGGRVTEIELFESRLNGQIPSELGSLTKLRRLNLSRNELTGPIPSRLGSLANLEELALWGNQLTGQIPSELGGLSNLRWMSLGSNRLTGTIPSELGSLSGLRDLWLDGNQLSGPIPASLGNLANLRGLYLYKNQLAGPIPASLGSLTNLEQLSLSRNQLTGPIPSELGSLANLQRLFLSNNRLTGCIPDALRNVGDDHPDNDPDHDLDRLGLPFCGEHACVIGGAVEDAANTGLAAECATLLAARDTLAGTASLNWSADKAITEWDGVTVESGRVTELRLSGHRLSGKIPAELGTLLELRVLLLQNNQLSGVIPAELGSLLSLEKLHLSGNPLTGCIPDGLRRVWENDLDQLGLSFCGDLACVVDGAVGDATNTGLALDCEALLAARDALAGAASLNWSADRPISEWDGVEVEGAPRRVTELHLQDNELSGTILPELGSLTKLRRLYLDRNELTGPVPPELGSLASLQWLSLWGNELTGEIPTELGSLSNLRWMSLGGNRLTGSIPSELGSLSRLHDLWLDGNQLSGPIPASLGNLANLSGLYLYNNQLSGSIPVSLGGLTSLQSLSLWGNELTGGIPGALGDLTNLERLSLNDNRLSGPIPAELGSMTNLQYLSLADNRLTGEIPGALGDLTNLERLYLNDNRLTGPIPAELGSLTNLQYLSLADNRVTGCIPTDLRDVADDRSDNDPDHDLDELGLPYCDVVLNGLSVSPRTLTPPFDPYHADYDALEGPALITVAATGGSSAIARVLDPGGAPIADADGSQAGHQVDLGTGIAGIRITVTSQDGRASNTYTIRVRPVSACVARGAVADATNSGLVSDCETLLAARVTLAGEATLDWWAGRPITEWDGVRVEGTPGRVTELRLGYNDLSGTIPSALGGLTNLRWLRLNDNELSGTVPSELGDLINLQGLSLRDNRLTGTLPQGLTGLARLWNFDFYNNPGLCAPVDDAFQAWLQGISNLRGSSCAPEDSAEDRTVLASLYRAAGGTSWGRNANWLSDLPIRDWHGVTADADGRVTGLHFWRNRLSGPQALDLLGSLANLEVLELGRNRLSGQIPASLGGLTKLEGLSLSGNQITGPIPPELGSLSSLESLYLRENRLTGPIPPELEGLSSLHTLSLEHNQLTGPIPASLGSLSNLGSLQLNDNRLTGQIPSELGGLSRLWRIALAGNRLTGCVPQELRDVWSNDFEELGLPFCDAMGSPEDRDALVALYNTTDGASWTNNTNWLSEQPLDTWHGVTTDGMRVTELHLQDNELSGTIPPELGSLTNLERLDLGVNQLTGPIPVELGSLTKLEELGLWGNQLTGQIPSELGSLSKLRELWLDVNQLNGPIPASLGRLSNLEGLNLSRNRLTGQIPTELGSLTNLGSLQFNDNRLTGQIPSELGGLSNLEGLNLSRNRLTGEIPTELGSLTNLGSLQFNDNRLTGQIPAELGGLSNLEGLNLSRNRLTGEIPTELGSLTNLGSLQFNDNRLTGQIPAELGGLSNLEGLNLSRNRLTGEIPGELGSLTNLERLSLNDNRLTGPIPAELRSLTNLQYLSLADNRLTGCIPTDLRDVADDRSDNDPDHDLDELGLPYCDVVLSGLSVSPRTLTPPFDPYRADYDALEGPSLITVSATGGRSAIVRVLDPGGAPIADADGSHAGHQVDLDTDIAGIRITVTSQDGRASNTYTIRVRPVSACVARGAVADEANSGLVSDCEALLAARDTLAEEATLDWSASRPITEWNGVRVEGTPGRVTELRLEHWWLNGSVSPRLGDLSSLRELRLGKNHLSGPIPTELGKLSALTHLDLENNDLSGPIPEELGGMSNLRVLLLGDNNLSGGVPAELGDLGKLTYLRIRNNDLTGQIPPELGKLNQLGSLYANNNDFSGPIPAELGRLSNLKYLFLNGNDLNGPIPAELGGLENLEQLYTHSNNLSGSIPSELGNLLNLKRLYAYNNDLNGVIPAELGGITGLERLHVANNNLTGEIPSTLGNIANLTHLSLSENDLTGSIPSSLGNLSSLLVLYLRNNELSGPIPAELGDLSELTHLYLSNNNLSGCVPEGLTDVESHDFDALGLDLCASS